MINEVLRLRDAGRFLDIRTNASCLTEGLSGDELSRAYLIVSQAYEKTVCSADDVRVSLSYAHRAIAVANVGSVYYVWAHGRYAALAADVGMFSDAREYGERFFELLPSQPSASPVAPWVYGALGRAYSRLGKQAKACASFEGAMRAEDEAFRELITIIYARALARFGRTSEAWNLLPQTVKYATIGRLHSAKALILAKMGAWTDAREEANNALTYVKNGEYKPDSFIECAELYLTLKACAHALKNYHEEWAWLVKSSLLLVAWDATLTVVLLSTFAKMGGERVDAETSHRDAAGYHRCGLRGTVG